MRELPPSLARHPNLDAWIRIEPDGRVTLLTGKAELGQGIKTALARIGAEELDVSLDRVRVLTADTAESPNEFYTAGSMSLEDSGSALRQAAVEARRLLLELAATRLEAPVEDLEVRDGTVKSRRDDRQVTYWELLGGKAFGRSATGEGVPKRPEQYEIIGKRGPRLDLPAKVTGAPAFVHDMVLPGMVHGRVVRPRGVSAKLLAVDLEAAQGLPGVIRVVRDGSFLGVLAEREEQAVRAAEKLRSSAHWAETASLPTAEALHDTLRQSGGQSFLVVEGTPVEGPIPPVEVPPVATMTREAVYLRPYHMHASLGPSAALAHMSEGKLCIWTHSQGVYPLRASLAQVLGMQAQDLRLIHVEGAGCYGHNGADDAALDAALLARALPGRPVLLQWMREDEHAWEPYGPAMVVRIQASLDAAGMVVDWNHDVWSNTHMGRSLPYGDTSNLLAAWHLERPMGPATPRPSLGPHVGIHRNADPLYDFPRRRVVKHFVRDAPLRVSSTRSLGAFANVFAIESFMDELAASAGADPVEFRLRHLSDPRARAVIEAAVGRSGWSRGRGGEGRGWGLGFARYKNRQCYAAVVVDLEVDSRAEIRLRRAVIAADAGQIIDPDGLANQLEGGFVQSASWTLKEEVRFDRGRITSLDWDSYPILKFPEVPEIETVLLDQPGKLVMGAGEAAQGPTSAAIANAVHAATGLRLRRMPFTPERLRSAALE